MLKISRYGHYPLFCFLLVVQLRSKWLVGLRWKDLCELLLELLFSVQSELISLGEHYIVSSAIRFNDVKNLGGSL